MWFKRRKKGRFELNLTCKVTNALTSSLGGSIECTCSNGASPIKFEWTRDSARLLATGDTIHSAVPGSYTVEVTDARGATQSTSVELELVRGPIVAGYIVTHASSDHARDGQVEAIVENCTPESKLLWTTGVVTDSCMLQDVRPGRYAATVLDPTGWFVHGCDAARVGIRDA